MGCWLSMFECQYHENESNGFYQLEALEVLIIHNMPTNMIYIIHFSQ